jgi:hypothetical protein
MIHILIDTHTHTHKQTERDHKRKTNIGEEKRKR